MSNVLKMAAVGGAVSAETDEDFNQTVLLLHGDGTNGAQNNTFLDGSTNNFTITRNGNTTQGTFSPFSVGAGEWSNYFDGSGDYLTAADNAAFELGSGDFTLECFVNFSALPTSNGHQATFFSKWGTTSQRSYQFYLYNNSGTYQLYLTYSTNGTASTDVGVNWTPTVGVWYHLACVRNGSNLLFFVNGNQQGSTGSISGTLSDQSVTLQIGTFANAANTFVNGYLSNARLVKGRAVYTSAFTPSTVPLGATSGGQNPPQGTETSLLTCQSNRFVDNGGLVTPNTITRNGDVRVTPFSPFAPSAAYDPAVNGGSGYFDGSGDYLSLAASSQFLPGVNTDFTFEAWVYLTAVPGATSAQIVGTGEYGTNSDWSLFVNSSRQPAFYINVPATGLQITSSTAINIREWNHIVATRSGTSTNNLKLFVNGVNVAQTSTNVTLDYTGNNLTLGADENGDESNLTGYISGLRLLNGTGYTSITTPTAPPTAITNTVLLTNFTNAGIFDNTGKNNLETVGNAQIDTTTKKFGTGSMEFDGSGDYLILPNNSEMTLGSGDFTVEGWLYLNSVSSTQFLIDQRPTSTQGVYPSLYMNSATLNWFVSSANRITSSNLSTNQWYHFAIVKSGSSTKMYIDGSQAGSTYTDTNNYLASRTLIGFSSFNDSPFNGFIDDLRITKGVARYTANFTAPTKEFPDQ